MKEDKRGGNRRVRAENLRATGQGTGNRERLLERSMQLLLGDYDIDLVSSDSSMGSGQSAGSSSSRASTHSMGVRNLTSDATQLLE